MTIYSSARRRAGALGKHILAACEPFMAALYWPCLKAKGELEDQQANEDADSWYLNPALRAGGKDGGQ